MPGPGRIRLEVDRLAARLSSSLPDHLADLLEVAAYVYVADQVASRGGTRAFDYGGRWRRRMRLAVPVRRPDLWTRPAVRGGLEAALGFLADEPWEFHFAPHPAPPPPDRYLTDQVRLAPGEEFDEVVLFSGGLDSLGGAVDEALVGHRRVVLVSHRPQNNAYARQRALADAVTARVPQPDLRPFHVAVAVNRGRAAVDDYTQRTRSFLFAAVAAIAAQLVGRDRVRFYENGVTGLNLPVSGELVGALASRTTHPQTLARFAAFFSALFDRPFAVQNPYQWLTKADVLARLKAHGHADLCAMTSSCVHTRALTGGFTHCGRCTQCVDRRLAALAAGLSDAEDPAAGYRSDVVTGERAGAELTLAERYTGFAEEFVGLPTAAAFAARYPEVSRALPYAGGAAGLGRLFDLYGRHAAGVRAAVRGAVAAHADRIARQAFPANSLLGVVVGRVEPAGGATAVRRDGAAGPPAGEFAVHPDRFAAAHGGRECFLGNTMEFRVLRLLWDRRKGYVPVADLMASVWDGRRVEKNTVQRTVSNLRRKLRDAGLHGVGIDGDQADHYRVVLAAPAAEPVAPA
jgi:7-cyano-7-deazaguanine synthase in queuosine biosynthesis